MRTTYKIRVRKDLKGNPFYQLTIPKEWIERTRATEIQFKNGDGNQLIIDPVTFSDEIHTDQHEANKPELKPDRSVEERIDDLFFAEDKEEDRIEGSSESLYRIDEVNKKYKK